MPECRFKLTGLSLAGKPRPRAAAINGKARLYMPSGYRQHQHEIRETAKRKAPKKPTAEPCTLSIVMGVEWPRSKWRKREPLPGGVPVTGKPDADQLSGTVMDALTGLVWLDDSQVWWSTLRRERVPQGEAGYVEVRVTW